jgi:hypothetical protein
MMMLVDEVTDMNEYGHFVDIDLCLNHKLNVETNKPNTVNVKKDNSNYVKGRTDKPFLTSINLFGFVTASILFFKIWILYPRS